MSQATAPMQSENAGALRRSNRMSSSLIVWVRVVL